MAVQTRFDDEEVTAAYDSSFGCALFNAYTLLRERDGRMFFSQRLRVVRAMVRAMLDEEALTAGERER